MRNLDSVDLVVIALYFAAVLGVAWWASLRRKEHSSDYFLAGRDAPWFLVGASLFVSNIGSEHLVGLAGTGAASGMAVGHFEWIASLILLLLGWLFVPFYLRSGVYTMPEFLARRYNSACRWYFTTISVIGYVLTKISVALYAGGIIIGEVTGLGIWYSAAVVVLITGLYTVVGGLRAVLFTDTMQAFVLVAGTLLLLGFGLAEAGGPGQLAAQLPSGFFDMWKPVDHPDFPWTGIVFGAPLLGVWYWCTDQYIVQRVLSARNEGEAQSGTVFAAWLKILPMFLFVLPGMIAAALFADVHAETADTALPTLVLRVLPLGLRGFLLAALLAALMSSLSSIFNSCSTLITWDFYKQLHPQASEKTLIRVGRIATGVLVVLGLLWIPLMKYISSQLYIYLQSVQGYIAPPIAACFLFGLFVRRLNGAGAITSLLLGFVLGACRLVLEFLNGVEKTGLPSGSVREWIAEVNFLHFAIMLFAICTLALFTVSMCTAPPDAERIRDLSFQAVERGERKPATSEELPELGATARRRKINIALSAALVIVMVVLWSIFS